MQRTNLSLPSNSLSSQDEVYESSAQELVSSVVQGYNGTILCYGQTGAGKTFTMTGSSTEYKYRGIVPRAVAQVYHEIADRFDQAITIRISYVEIYNEMVSDYGDHSTCYRCSISYPPFPLMNSRRLL